ncbi:FAD-dependent oxidoreductase [Saccharopolyspora sp. NPDC000995]
MRVVIAGAGIGGLCLAQGLTRAGITCSVYERSPAISWSGYLLHMNADGGLGLRTCLPHNLYELYEQTSRVTPRRDVFVLQDYRGNEVATKPHIGPPNDPIVPHTTVHRRTLCQIMLHGIENVVHFGRPVGGYQQSAAGVTVELADGEEVTADVLIGADGINSVIRRQLLPDAEVDVLVEHVLLSKAPLTPTLRHTLPDAFDDSFVITMDPIGSLMAASVFEARRNFKAAAADLAPGLWLDEVDDYVSVSIEPAAESIGLSRTDFFAGSKPSLHTVMRRAVAHWHPGLQYLVANVLPSSIVPKTNRVVRPVAAWRPSNVTVLGDAIHAMPPMLGDGANSALRDAGSLATALIDAAAGRVGLIEAIEGYEDEMRTRTYPLLESANI